MADNLELVHDIDPTGGKVLAVRFDPTRPEIAAGTRDGVVHLVGAESGDVRIRLRGHREFVYCLTYHPDGEWLISSGKDTTIRLWDIESGEFKEDWAGIVRGPGARTMYNTMSNAGQGHTKTPLDICFNHDGEYFGSGGQDHLVKLWHDHRPLRTFNWHGGPVTAVAFRPGTAVLLSGSRDGTLRTWNPDTGSMIHKYTGHQDEIEAAVWIDEHRFASADVSGRIMFWREAEERPEEIVRENHTVRCLAATPDGKRVFAGLENGDIVVRNTDTGRKSSNQKLATLEGHDLAVRSLDVDREGKLLASGGNEGRLKVWAI